MCGNGAYPNFTVCNRNYFTANKKPPEFGGFDIYKLKNVLPVKVETGYLAATAGNNL